MKRKTILIVYSITILSSFLIAIFMINYLTIKHSTIYSAQKNFNNSLMSQQLNYIDSNILYSYTDHTIFPKNDSKKTLFFKQPLPDLYYIRKNVNNVHEKDTNYQEQQETFDYTGSYWGTKIY